MIDPYNAGVAEIFAALGSDVDLVSPLLEYVQFCSSLLWGLSKLSLSP